MMNILITAGGTSEPIDSVRSISNTGTGRLGSLIAEALTEDAFADSEKIILNAFASEKDFFSGNTVIGCIMTNAALTKAQAARLAALGHNAIARTVHPAHSVYDGDTVFALCGGKLQASADSVGILAVRAAQTAILNAVKSAQTYGSYLAYKDLAKRYDIS